MPVHCNRHGFCTFLHNAGVIIRSPENQQPPPPAPRQRKRQLKRELLQLPFNENPVNLANYGPPSTHSPLLEVSLIQKMDMDHCSATSLQLYSLDFLYLPLKIYNKMFHCYYALLKIYLSPVAQESAHTQLLLLGMDILEGVSFLL